MPKQIICILDNDGGEMNFHLNRIHSMTRLGDSHTVIRYRYSSYMGEFVVVEPYNQVLRKYVEAMNGKNS